MTTDMSVYMARRRGARRAKLLELRNNECEKCGSIEELQFDHIDPATKKFNLSGCYLDKKWETILEELDKCQLLCVECHYTKSVTQDWERVVDHGGGLTGKRNCRCELCAPLKDAYNKKYKKKVG